MDERVEEHGVLFATGVPVRFRFARNTEQTPRLPRHIQPKFGQDIEPAGRYMLHAAPSFKPVGPWIEGDILFTRPLVMEYVNTSSDARGWKRRLSKAFGGKKGKALSKAIVRAGYDGIVTVDNGRTSEIVDLTTLMRETFRPNPVEGRMARRNPVESQSQFKPHSLERGEDPTTRDNPPPADAEERYTTAHWGINPTKVYKTHIPGEPDDAAMTEMGKLIELWVRPRKRDRADALKINFPKNSKCILAFTTDERERLYCVMPRRWRDEVKRHLVLSDGHWYTLKEIAHHAGGRQSKFPLPDREAQVLGRLTNVVYATWKKGDDDAKEGCEYIHRMGEEGGIEPYLAVDSEGYLWICGGTYSVPDDGITN